MTVLTVVQISGPNLGWNTSCQFATIRWVAVPQYYFLAAYTLSSGTIGAALSSSLSKTRSIALSYEKVEHPTSADYFEPIYILSCDIILYLWQNWGKDEEGTRNGEVDLYNVNVPIVDRTASDSGPKICWTSVWRNSYGNLFTNFSGSGTLDENQAIRVAGPDEQDNDDSSSLDSKARDLLFSFSPDWTTASPAQSDIPIGSDAWAIRHGWVSVSPLRASFAQPPTIDDGEANGGVREIKL